MLHFLLALLLHLLPLSSSLRCYTCYSFTSDSPAMTEYLPPLLRTVSVPCTAGMVVTCAANQTCISATFKLIYGRSSAAVQAAGCAGIESATNQKGGYQEGGTASSTASSSTASTSTGGRSSAEIAPLNCVDMFNRYYHPLFDLEECVVERCSGELCNGKEDHDTSPISRSPRPGGTLLIPLFLPLFLLPSIL